MLDKPGAFWVVFTGEPEKPAGQATPDQLAKFIDQAEMQPGQGIVLQGGQWRTVAGLMPSGVQANALRTNLQTAGYPAEVLAKDGKFEVRINQLATREDAEAVLKQLQANTALGVTEAAAWPWPRAELQSWSCAQALSSRFTLTGCGVRSSCAKKLTRSSSSNQRSSCRRASCTPLRSATRRQKRWSCGRSSASREASRAGSARSLSSRSCTAFK